jgi:serine/threonine-protein kinase
MTTDNPGQFLCMHCNEWHPDATESCPSTGQQITEAQKLVGKVMEGKYKILRVLGEGGMGVVYEANHTLIGRRLAVKVLHPDVSTMDDLVERFYNEARTAAAIGHEHIIEITDMGSHNGAPFIVMEFLEGHALTDLMQERVFSMDEAVAISLQVLDALNAVHAAGVIHRDLKPDNVHILNKAGRQFVKILDFGISKLKTPEVQDMHLTRTGTVLGTPYYMAPEQAAGKKDQDHRIDIYAAGVILYEMLTGALPYTGDNYNALLAAILTEEAPTPRTYNPDIPVELENVIMTAIAKQPGQRFGNAVKFMEALRPFAPSWIGRPSKIPGLTQTQGGPPPAQRPAGEEDLGSSQTLMAPTPLPTGSGQAAPQTGVGPAQTQTGETDWSVTADSDVTIKKSKAPLIAVAVVAVIVLAGGGVTAALLLPSLLKGDEKGPEPIKQVAARETEPAEEAEPEQPPPEPPAVDPSVPKVELGLVGVPEGAEVTLDGVILGELPADVPKLPRERKLVVEADGYEKWQTSLVLDAPKTVKVDLQPEKSGGSSRKKKGGKASTSTAGKTDEKADADKPVFSIDKKPPEPPSVTVKKKKKKTKGIYSGKRKNIDLEYPE